MRKVEIKQRGGSNYFVIFGGRFQMKEILFYFLVVSY